MNKTLHIGFMALALSGAASCTASSEPPVSIDRFRELEIVDESVLGDVRTENGHDGPLSFRHVVEEVADGNEDELVASWFRSWSDDAASAYEIRTIVECPWLKRSPSNACNDDCSACSAHHYDLALAPARLIAISNRIDLGEMPDATSTAGEGRLVFALTKGVSDEGAEALPVTAIFEFVMPGERVEWAKRWHALAAVEERSLPTAVADVTERFVNRRQGGARLAQLRTNDGSLGAPKFREYAVARGVFTPRPLRNTPPSDKNDGEVLTSFILEHADDVRGGTFVLPTPFRAMEITSRTKWEFRDVEEDLGHAFATGTCNGCHGQVGATVDGVFHISPFRKGRAKLSPFLNDQGSPETDDLARRELFLRTVLEEPH